ncbi:hypothetical protein GC177_07400 [bacterium]|nr:hypothetical protein [bacterium]
MDYFSPRSIGINLYQGGLRLELYGYSEHPSAQDGEKAHGASFIDYENSQQFAEALRALLSGAKSEQLPQNKEKIWFTTPAIKPEMVSINFTSTDGFDDYRFCRDLEQHAETHWGLVRGYASYDQFQAMNGLGHGDEPGTFRSTVTAYNLESWDNVQDMLAFFQQHWLANQKKQEADGALAEASVEEVEQAARHHSITEAVTQFLELLQPKAMVA